MDFNQNICAGYNGEKLLKSVNRNHRYCKNKSGPEAAGFWIMVVYMTLCDDNRQAIISFPSTPDDVAVGETSEFP